MKGKPVHFAYGIKLVALWMLIPFVLMFIPRLANEFKFQMTTAEVMLKKETFSYYPDEYSCYETEINGNTINVHAPVTSRVGQKITVILRDGNYYKTVWDEQDIRDYMTTSGRFLRICNNNFGYHVIVLAVALLISFLLTLNKGKEIRSGYPKLSKITNIAGIIVSVIMSVALLYGVIANTLTGLCIAYLTLMLGIVYTVVFVLAWGIECSIYTFAK